MGSTAYWMEMCPTPVAPVSNGAVELVFTDVTVPTVPAIVPV